MDELLRHLRERKLVQWALAYAAGAFAPLQGVDMFAQRFGWPEWIPRALLMCRCSNTSSRRTAPG